MRGLLTRAFTPYGEACTGYLFEAEMIIYKRNTEEFEWKVIEQAFFDAQAFYEFPPTAAQLREFILNPPTQVRPQQSKLTH